MDREFARLWAKTKGADLATIILLPKMELSVVDVQMNLPDCELSILVARTDVAYLKHTVSHLVRACNYPFARKVLIVDTAPLGGQYKNRKDIAPMEALYQCCQELIKEGVIDEQIAISYEEETRRKVYTKHLGCDLPITHDYRGYPNFGSMFYIENARSPYLVHFDSDMLLHQNPDFNWIKRGIELMQADERIVCVLPLSGPPHPEGKLYELASYIRNRNGFLEFKSFTSRIFVLDVRRFQSLLPLSLQFRKPYAIPLKPFFGEVIVTTSAMLERNVETWESMLNERLENTSYVRANLTDPRAWSLHALDHGPEFIAMLPQIIQQIEGGTFPSVQAGHYDLELSFWT